jgi:hypothetical protein
MHFNITLIPWHCVSEGYIRSLCSLHCHPSIESNSTMIAHFVELQGNHDPGISSTYSQYIFSWSENPGGLKISGLYVGITNLFICRRGARHRVNGGVTRCNHWLDIHWMNSVEVTELENHFFRCTQYNHILIEYHSVSRWDNRLYGWISMCEVKIAGSWQTTQDTLILNPGEISRALKLWVTLRRPAQMNSFPDDDQCALESVCMNVWSLG